MMKSGRFQLHGFILAIVVMSLFSTWKIHQARAQFVPFAFFKKITSAMTSLPSWSEGFAYAVGNGGVSQFSIQPSGQLSPLPTPTIAAGSNPWNMVINSTGTYAYVVNFSSNNVSQFSVGSNGQLASLSPATVSAGSGAHDLAITPNDSNLYVSLGGTNIVKHFPIGGDGKLGTGTDFTVNNNPKGIAVSPDGGYLYIGYDSVQKVTRATITNGVLSNPTDYTISSSCSQMAITSDGKYLYCNATSGLTAMTISAADGSLSNAIFRNNVVSNNLSFGLSPLGNYLYVGVHSGNAIATYAIPSGVPSYIPGNVTPDTPTGVKVSIDGKYVYAASYNLNRVYQYMVLPSGQLTPLPVPTVTSLGLNRGMALLFKGVTPAVSSLFSPIPTPSASAASYCLAVTSSGINVYSGIATSSKTSYATATTNNSYFVLSPNKSHMYVGTYTGAQTTSIAQFSLSPAGVPSPLPTPTLSVSTGATNIAISNDGKFVYLFGYPNNGYYLFSRNTSTGQLTAVGVSSLSYQIHALAFLGDYAYAVSNSAGVHQFSINPTSGVLVPRTTAIATGPRGGNGLGFSPNGSFAYLLSPNNIDVYKTNSDYTLSYNGDSNSYNYGSYQNPLYIAFTPDFKFAYTGNQANAYIYGFNVNATTGALTPINNFNGSGGIFVSSCCYASYVTVSPDSTYLYVPGQGTNYRYTINATTGALSNGITWINNDNNIKCY